MPRDTEQNREQAVRNIEAELRGLTLSFDQYIRLYAAVQTAGAAAVNNYKRGLVRGPQDAA